MKARLIKWLLSLRSVQGWLLYAERPEAQRPEVVWTKEDATVMENFIENATGQKFMAELENLRADADTNAILRGTPDTAYGLVCIARGVRVTTARIKRLTAVRQNPDNHEAEQVSLPADLEHLSDT